MIKENTMGAHKISKPRSEEQNKEIFDKWHSLINMDQRSLTSWAKNDDRLLASINRSEAKEEGGIQSGYDSFHRIKRRKKKPFEGWTSDDFDNASQENGFNSRMLGGKPGQPVGGSGMSKWEISLRNWGHDPSLESSPAYNKWESWNEKHTKKASNRDFIRNAFMKKYGNTTTTEVLRELEIRVAHLESMGREEFVNSIEMVIGKTPSQITIDRVEYPSTRQEFLNIEASNVPVIFVNCPLSTKITNRLDLFKSGFNPLVKARRADRKGEDIGDRLEINLQDLLKSDFKNKTRYIGKHRLSQEDLRDLLEISIYDEGQILAKRGVNSVNMWCGPEGCITPLHLDTINNLAWNIYGRKTWLLVSPKDMYLNSYLKVFREAYIQDERGVWVRNDLERDPSFSSMAENPLSVSSKDFPKAERINFHEIVLKENEMLYLPAYWGHYVKTNTDSLMINHWYDQIPSILGRTQVL
jgi:hypothetical protein